VRYFIHLSYLGTRFHGWQRQPHSISIQEVIEQALSTYLKRPTSIMGCGRTDTGVHARSYYAHVDVDGPQEIKSMHRSVNALSGNDIVIHRIFEVDDKIHARFDAGSRTYQYLLSTQPDPFLQGLQYVHLSSHDIDLQGLQSCADVLMSYQDFLPFTKTNSDTPHYKCDLQLISWEQTSPTSYTLNITSNRFLRGMVRLIVGMCIQVSEGKVQLDDIRSAMDRQIPLVRSWSVPASGLYLAGVTYPGLGIEN
ncbi:UNVERIFIED_CONTAM: hypothetical protein GTU68_021143, partial [Idotea baltica]|nr:hypothetical protein [Idotea baltica]